MAFLKDLQRFDPNALKQVEIHERSVDGTVTVRGKDPKTGEIKVKGVKEKASGQFMVADLSPDEELHTVLPGLHIGSQDAAQNLPGIQKAGVQLIVNAGYGIRNFFSESKDIEYVVVEALDVPEFDMRPVFRSTSAAIHKALKSNPQKGVLVHCNAGVSRSATLIMAYLIEYEGMSFDVALATLRKARPAACPNTGFTAQLKAFKKELSSQ